MLVEKKRIFVNFVDFPKASYELSLKNNFLLKILQKHYDVIMTEKPDFLFYNVFGNSFEKFSDCVKIFFTNEVVAPNFNECDYAIGYDYINFENRYFRFPFAYREITPSVLDKSQITFDMAKRKFCNFIYSNENYGEGARIRKEFCLKLAEYKKVDCPGKVLNNMENAINGRFEDFAAGKLKFQKNYKFTIAFENSLYSGYTTEKLTHAFLANTIPIYWGNPEVVRDFNSKAFINCNDYDNFDDVINRVIELDNNDEEYIKMLMEPCVNLDYNFNKLNDLEHFLISIIERGNKPFNKNPYPSINKYGWVGETFEDKIRNSACIINALERQRIRYRILKNLTFGKKRLRYISKYKECKDMIGELRCRQ